MRQLVRIGGGLAALLLTSSTCHAGDKISIEAVPDRQKDLNDIIITARADAVTITELSVNRGNCKGGFIGARVPLKMRFGQAATYRVFPCIPIEITVNFGETLQTFTFGPKADADVAVNVQKFFYGLGNSNNLLRLTAYEPMKIKEIEINRGACGSVFGSRTFDPPKEMKFGDFLEIGPFNANCNPIEAKVINDGEPIIVDLSDN